MTKVCVTSDVWPLIQPMFGELKVVEFNLRIRPNSIVEIEATILGETDPVQQIIEHITKRYELKEIDFNDH